MSTINKADILLQICEIGGNKSKLILQPVQQNGLQVTLLQVATRLFKTLQPFLSRLYRIYMVLQPWSHFDAF